MNTFLALALLALILVPVVLALEVTHRRTAHLPRCPFGFDEIDRCRPLTWRQAR